MFAQRGRRLGLALGALLLALLVGCQSVGGVNLNDMMVGQLEVKSSESVGSVEIGLDWDDQKLAEEDPQAAEAIGWFRKVALKFDQAKIDKYGNAYAAGTLELSKGDIPFTLNKDKSKLLLQVEGAKRPIVLDALGTGAESLLPGLNGGADETTEGAFEEAARKLVHEVAAYLVGHLPNPPVVKVETVTAPIHGVSTELTKVHAELNGKQLGELIPSYLDSIAGDEDGLRKLFGDIVQWSADLPPELKREIGFPEEEAAPSREEIDQAVQELLGFFQEARQNIEDARQEKSWNELFNEGIQLKTDLYVDRSLHLRKADTELTLSSGLLEQSGLPLRGVTVRSSQEMWNVNGNVAVPSFNVPFNAIDGEKLGELKPFQVVKLFEENSTIYRLLKNDLQIDDQRLELGSDWGVPFVTAGNGDLYVPIRATVEGLDGEFIAYDAGTGHIRFRDEATRQGVLLQIGTRNAKVNGEPVRFAHDIVAVDGVAYASADDLLGVLHAKYSLSEGEDGEDTLVITRDL
ncbi:stalk domain-containing protein [Cohnella thermotolerans]|uniref:stalk domain-containing protein n=1 Tax=Cohnella thermotolerans TaxID=329858 RepID=UPI000478941A|nr:stalk domain-containing protein [Cohnella thermotolerans]